MAQIDDLLTRARAGLTRLEPTQAAGAARSGGVLVDIRPEGQRHLEGEIPGSLLVERNVLEWRFDPGSDAALTIAGHDLHVIVVCSQGYASSLAAASLQELGIRRATDLIGGFQAWRDAGLATAPGGRLVPERLAPGVQTLPGAAWSL
jgi:rhodanese-related sulfurtransferase